MEILLYGYDGGLAEKLGLHRQMSRAALALQARALPHACAPSRTSRTSRTASRMHARRI